MVFLYTVSNLFSWYPCLVHININVEMTFYLIHNSYILVVLVYPIIMAMHPKCSATQFKILDIFWQLILTKQVSRQLTCRGRRSHANIYSCVNPLITWHWWLASWIVGTLLCGCSLWGPTVQIWHWPLGKKLLLLLQQYICITYTPLGLRDISQLGCCN